MTKLGQPLTSILMKKLSGFLVLTLFLCFSSCSSVGNLNPLSLLTGNNWVLNSMLGKALDPAKFASGFHFSIFRKVENWQGLPDAIISTATSTLKELP
jgi:hypothetical protein